MNIRKFSSLAGFYLHFADETLGGVLLHLGDLLMVSPVVFALTLDVDVLGSLPSWVPLDLFHFVIRGRGGLVIVDLASSNSGGGYRAFAPIRDLQRCY